MDGGALIANFFFADMVGQDMWQIYYKEYDANGHLLELVTSRCRSIRMHWRRITAFLRACKTGRTREIQFHRNGKYMPSLVSQCDSLKWCEPIVAKLPLFEYMGI